MRCPRVGEPDTLLTGGGDTRSRTSASASPPGKRGPWRIIETVCGEVTPGAVKVCGLGHAGFETAEVGREAAPQKGVVLDEEHGQPAAGRARRAGEGTRVIRAKGSTQKLPDRRRGEEWVGGCGASRG